MDFTDVLEGRCSLERAAVAHPVIRGLYLLTAPILLPVRPLSGQAMAQLVRQAKEDFDFVLMDSPAGLGEGFQLAVCAADRAVVVCTTDASALRDAQRTVALLRGRISRIHLVVNRVQPRLLQAPAIPPSTTPWIPPAAPAGRGTGGPPGDALRQPGRTADLAASRGAAVAYLNIAKRLLGQRSPLMKLK